MKIMAVNPDMKITTANPEYCLTGRLSLDVRINLKCPQPIRFLYLDAYCDLVGCEVGALLGILVRAEFAAIVGAGIEAMLI